jgi:hypothetical protein
MSSTGTAIRRPLPAAIPRLAELPEPPPGKEGWPWTEDSHIVIGEHGSVDDLPTVAVVTPSFQQAEFLEETIRSVLLQGYPKLSYAIMDGGSTDGSAAIIQKYSQWLAYWVSGPDGGQAQAIDTGFEQIDGEILVWLNSDDVFTPGAVWHAAQAFVHNRDAVVVYGNAIEIARDGAYLGTVKCVRQADRQYMIQVDLAIAQPSAYFRRTAYEAAGKLDHSLNWTLDYDLWIRLTEQGAIIHIPETLAQLRIYPEAKTSLGVPAMFEEYRLVGERYGGYALLNHMGWIVPTLVPKALEAIRNGDLARGAAWLTSVIANDPAWRSNRRLGDALAAEFWRSFNETGEDISATLTRVTQLCRALPRKFVSPEAVERRILALLYQALAFRNYGRRQTRQTLEYVVRAFAQGNGRLFDRGLWSIALRTMLGRR